jgi:hypothetical protein
MVQRANRHNALKTSLFGLLLPILVAVPISAGAARYDIIQTKPFGLLEMDGRVRIGYLFDERGNDSGLSSTSSSEATWEEEFFLTTKSFIYHPGLLNIVLGGGPVFVQQQAEDGNGSGSRTDTLFNIQSRLNFLDIKSYPVSVYYDKSHPSITRGSTTRFIVPNERYGISSGLQSLFANSTTLNFNAYKHSANGSGEGYSVDDEIEQAVFTAYTSYRQTDSIQFKYDRWDQESASGSPGRPINRSDEKRRIAEFRLENFFGDDKRISISQLLTRLRREITTTQASTLEDYRYRGNMKWRHDEKTNSSIRLGYVDSQRSSSLSKSRNAAYSVSKILGNGVSVGGGASYATSKNVGFERRNTGLQGRVSYRYETIVGPLSLSASMRKASVDQESVVSDIEVFDEAITLTGTNPVDLANEFVVEGSVTIRNFTNTQDYIEGIDYRVFSTGSVTTIQRLLGGEIADGETVLVDYRYATSGTAKYDTTDLGASANIALGRYLNAYTRYDTSDTDVISGELTNQVNNRDRFEAGVNVRNRPIDGWSVTGDYRYINQQDDLAPFTSNVISVGLAKRFWGRISVSISAGYLQSDYENSDEDDDQASYGLGLSGSPFRGANLNYDVAYVEDVGGTLARKSLRHRVNFQWGFRMVRVTLTGSFSDDELGTSANFDDRVSLEMTRYF